MNYIEVVVFAAVQAITEFVPVSSSGHLVILHNFFPGLNINTLQFDVILHAGTLLAVLVFFAGDIISLVTAFMQSIFSGRRGVQVRLSWLLFMATIPAALAGYFFENIIEAYLRSTLIVALMLVVVGAVFLLVERKARHLHDVQALSPGQALLIGCAQAVALIPGTSRSGITIIAGMAAGLKREAAVRFSFLLSAPIILGANVKKIIPAAGTIFSQGDTLLFLTGFVVSFALGYIVIKYLLIFVRDHSLAIFAYYRFALAAGLLLLELT